VPGVHGARAACSQRHSVLPPGASCPCSILLVVSCTLPAHSALLPRSCPPCLPACLLAAQSGTQLMSWHQLWRCLQLRFAAATAGPAPLMEEICW
jgi:hypothetical protein